ncbi:ras gtpase-activating protein [Anaeramoeba flamelloides]|uniref:Ras gtpase-activating protein n=1 Tax=Anaeramoeba flamelloides TaxID=1746091 RepID=A0ABQ8ZFH7_9EUKA|nr:ras gtpase-activating protein [Anaeramoeba flamelloides]
MSDRNEYKRLLRKLWQKKDQDFQIFGLIALKDWVNETLSSSNYEIEIEDFSEDLEKCKTLPLLFHCLMPSLGFDKINDLPKKKQRAKAFVKLLAETELECSFPTYSDITDGNETALVILIATLYFWKKEPNTNTKNEKQKKKKNQKDKKTEKKPKTDSNKSLSETTTSDSSQETSNSENENPETNGNTIDSSTKTTSDKTNMDKENNNEFQNENENQFGNEIENLESQLGDLQFDKLPKNLTESSSDNSEDEDEDLTSIQELSLLQEWSGLGDNLLTSIGNHNVKVLTFFKKLGLILPEYLPMFGDLKKQLNIIGTFDPKKQFRYVSSNTILDKTFFKILKSHDITVLDIQFKNPLKEKFRTATDLNEPQISTFLGEIMDICKNSQIITDEKSELSRSIITLIDQYFYSTVLKMRLTEQILTRFITEKICTVKITQSENEENKSTNNLTKSKTVDHYEIIRKNIYTSFDRYMPGFADLKTAKRGIEHLFEMVNLSEKIKPEELNELLLDARREAFGRTMYLIIQKYFGSSFYDEIIQFFEKSKKGKNFQELWNKEILPQCRTALEDFLIREDAENLIFSVESSICREHADPYATELLCLLDSLGLVLPFVKVGIIQEVLKNPSPGSLFRSNDVISKVLKYYMKMIGKEYLSKTLVPTLQEIIDKNLDFEIDTFDITDKEQHKKNLNNLKTYLHKLLNNIFRSTEWMPMEMKIICSYYAEVTKKKYPQKVLATVGGFIFLRVICPTIVAPVRLGFATGEVTKNVRRAFMLLSSIIQAMSNEILFKESREYMMVINDDLKELIPKSQNFLKEISNSQVVDLDPILQPYSTSWEKHTKGPINDIFVHDFFLPNENEKISSESFAANLLIDIKKYLNLEITSIGMPYFEGIYGRLDKSSNIISNLTKTVKQLEFITQMINNSGGWLSGGGDGVKQLKKMEKKKKKKDKKRKKEEKKEEKKKKKTKNK